MISTRKNAKKISFFLMGKKGSETLKAAFEAAPGAVGCVIAARDRNVLDDHYAEIKKFCSRHGIRFYDRGKFKGLETPYAIAAAWRWLIEPRESRLVVFHDSLLPKYRGFNPLVSALINGDSTVGVSALDACQEFDRGPLLAQVKVAIKYPIKIAEAIDAVSLAYRELTLKVVSAMARGALPKGKPQNERKASYSLWRDEDDYRIDWTKDSVEICRFIDAVGFPYKGASALVGERPARILGAELVKDVKIENRVPGKVLFAADSLPVVVCGKGLLKITELLDAKTGKNMLPLPVFRVRFK